MASANDEAVVERAARLPFDERVGHKNWRVRNAAYAFALEYDKASPEEVAELVSLLAGKGVTDSNAAAQEKALEALTALLERSPERLVARHAKEISVGVVAKALSGRAATLQRAGDVCAALCEGGAGDTVVDALVSGFGHKTPKVACNAVGAVLQLLSEFGPGVVQPRPVLGALPGLFGSRTAQLRDLAKQLAAEMARWIGADGIRASIMEQMRDAMKRDVEDLLATKNDEAPPQPTRYTRKERARLEAAAAAAQAAGEDQEMEGADEGPSEAPAAQLDAYVLSAPADVLGQLGKPFWAGLESRKWSERRDALLHLKAATGRPKLQSGDYGDVCRGLQRVIAKDSNVVCVAEAVQCVGNMAAGLRREFAQHARQLASCVLERLKEKKTSVTDPCRATLAALTQHCVSLTDVVDEALEKARDKNPQIRAFTVAWIETCVVDSKPAAAQKLHKDVLPALVAAAQDATPEVRDAAISAICAFARAAGGVATLERYLKQLDAPKRKALDDRLAAPGGGAAASAHPSPSRSATLPAGRLRAGSSFNAGSAGTSARGGGGAERPPTATASRGSLRKSATARPKALAAAVSASAPAVDDADVQPTAMSKEEALGTLGAFLPAAAVQQIGSSNWKERLEGMSAVRDAVGAAAATVPAGAVLAMLSALPGWSEKNFQVFQRVLETISTCAASCPSFSRRDGALAVEGAADRLADGKLRAAACDALNATAEALGPQFVAVQLHARATAAKSPKVKAEALTWLAAATVEFGLREFDVAWLLNAVKADLSSATPAIRSAAIKVLGAMHRTVGPPLRGMIENDVKPALMASVDEELGASPQDNPAPSRRTRGGVRQRGSSRGRSASAGPNDGEVEMDDAGPDTSMASANADEVLPREDVSAALAAPSWLTKMGSANWKERRLALTHLSEVLSDAGNRVIVAADAGGELMAALKHRMSDANKMLAAMALALLGQLAGAVGKPVDKWSRLVLPEAVANVADKKKAVREACVDMMGKWCATGPQAFESVLQCLHETLGDAKKKCPPEGKSDSLAWLAEAVRSGSVPRRHLRRSEALNLLVGCAAQGLADKSVQARDAGAALVAALMDADLPPADVAAAVDALPRASRDLVQTCVARNGGGVEELAATASALRASAAARPTTAPTGARARSPSPAAVRASANAPAALRASSARLPASAKAVLRVPDGDGSLFLAAGCTPEARAQRARRMRHLRASALKWEEPRGEDDAALKADLEKAVSKTLLDKMFCARPGMSFRAHAEAAAAVAGALADEWPAVSQCLDLLVRWATARVCEGNSQSLLRSLEMLQAVCDELRRRGEQLSDYEAALLLPTLVEKAGHNQDRVKMMHRALFRTVQAVTAPAVTRAAAEALARGLESGNKRTRVVWLEEIAHQIEEATGLAPFCKARVLPAAARQVAEKENAVRNAAVAACAAGYRNLGEERFWQEVGSVPDATKKSLVDKFKFVQIHPSVAPQRSDQTATPVRIPRVSDLTGRDPSGNPVRPTTAPAAHTPLANTSTLPPATPGALDVSMASPAPAAAAPAPAPNPHGFTATWPARPPPPPDLEPTAMGAHVPPTPSPGPGSAQQRTREAVAQWQRAVRMVTGADRGQAVEGMKMVCHELMGASQGVVLPSALDTFALDADALTAALVTQQDDAIRGAVEAPEDAQGHVRVAKYTTNTLMQMFSVSEMAQCVSEPTLKALTASLLNRLLDARLRGAADGVAISRALNVLMLRVVDAANRDFAFSFLIEMLADPPVQPPPGSTEDDVDHFRGEFVECVIRCLIRLTKTLQAPGGVDAIDVDALLLSAHTFLMELGLEEIRRRGQGADKPLRMVKTVVHQLCRALGPRIRDHLSLLPARDPADPSAAAAIHKYIDINLETLAGEERTSGAFATQQHPAGDAAGAAQAPTPGTTPAASPLRPMNGQRTPGAHVAITKELTRILRNVARQETAEAGLAELEAFLERNPGLDLDAALTRCSTSDGLRRYVHQRLAEHAQRGGGAENHPERPPLTRSPSKIPAPSGDVGGSQSAAATPRPELSTLSSFPLSVSSSMASSLQASKHSSPTHQDKRVAAAAGSAPRASTTLDQLKERMERIRAQQAESGIAPPGGSEGVRASMSFADVQRRMAEMSGLGRAN
ncbi:unnamed protein product [Pedinophyceae sp. YPF-701]|nr:unnamed protein product [Pedinophyceae sp. YPF-701]